MDYGAVQIESLQQPGFVGLHAGFNSLEGILVHEKCGLAPSWPQNRTARSVAS
jgi:hypothetical protein